MIVEVRFGHERTPGTLYLDCRDDVALHIKKLQTEFDRWCMHLHRIWRTGSQENIAAGRGSDNYPKFLSKWNETYIIAGKSPLAGT
ncbi:Uncharacterised protein [Paenibacillus thiaminolyticus]|nr:Uncharacterised protein [Paenibacillus thiaminolyticus]